jgi:hypothetical protein
MILKDLRGNSYIKHDVSEKLGVKSDKYKFVGYPKENIIYYLYCHIKQKCFSQNMLPF